MKFLSEILGLFDGRERRQFGLLLLVLLGTAVMETAGVASIMPFMAMVARPDLALENRYLASLYEAVGVSSVDQFLVVVGVGVLLLLAASNALSATSTWLLFRFTWHKHHRLAVDLLEGYLQQPYTYYLSRNTANLSTKLLAEVGSVVTGVLNPLMQLLAKGFAAALILGLLVVVDPRLALTVAVVLGGAYALVYLNARRKLGRIGVERVAASRARFKIAAEALGGIKDVKVLGREASFLEQFRGPSEQFSNHSASNQIIGQLPRYALETVAFGGVLLIVLYLLTVHSELERVLPVVSLYALAGYRLMPALQQVFQSLAQIRFNRPALDELAEDLRTMRPAEAAATSAPVDGSGPLEFGETLRVRGLSFRYPLTEGWALRDVNLSIPRNHTVAFVGPTGSGKTTLVDVLLGLLVPEEGELLADDAPITPRNAVRWRRNVGYVPQQIFLTDDTIARNIAFGVPEEEIDWDAVVRSARVAHLHDFVMDLPAGYDTVVGERGVRLSGGQRQRVGIARALYHDPNVLILDEATSALDGITEGAVMQAIGELAHRKTLILIAHRLSTVRDCDQVYMLDGGQVVASGTYEELIQSNAQFQAMANLVLAS